MYKLGKFRELKAVLPLLILILLATNVSAIGVARGFGSVNFVPNTEVSLQYYVFNDEHKAGTAIISLEGSMKDKAIVDPSYVNYTADEELIPFTVKVSLPDKPEGDLSVVVESEPESRSQFTARIRVVQRIQFSQEEKKVEQPLNVTKPRLPSFRELILPIQNISIIKTTIGKTMLYIALLATIISVIAYLVNTYKRKPEEIVEEQTEGLLGGDKEKREEDKNKKEEFTPNPELVNYLKKGSEIGVADELLTSKLTLIGWEKDTIDRHIEYVRKNK